MPNRYLCTVLDEMRTCCKTSNFSYLMGLIEEAQVMGERMEAALYDKNDLNRARKEHEKLRESLKAREREIAEANERLAKLKEEVRLLRREKNMLLAVLHKKEVVVDLSGRTEGMTNE